MNNSLEEKIDKILIWVEKQEERERREKEGADRIRNIMKEYFDKKTPGWQKQQDNSLFTERKWFKL